MRCDEYEGTEPPMALLQSRTNLWLINNKPVLTDYENGRTFMVCAAGDLDCNAHQFLSSAPKTGVFLACFTSGANCFRSGFGDTVGSFVMGLRKVSDMYKE